MGITARYARLLAMARSLEQHMSQYGYTLIDTPIIDHADLFLTKAGDQIIERLFTFQRSGRQLSLRPEFTAGAAYRYVSEGFDRITRWQFQGMVFEDNPSNIAQDRQRFSVGAELIGASGIVADAEIIAMAVLGVGSQGIRDWYLKIGNVGLMRYLLSTYGLDGYTQKFILNRRYLLQQNDRASLEAALRSYIQTDASITVPNAGEELNTHDMVRTVLDATQRNNTMGGRTREDIARRLIRKRQQAAQHAQIQSAIDFLEKWVSIKGSVPNTFEEINILSTDDTAQHLLNEWKSLIALLQTYGISGDNIILQPDLAHNWDYYTGTVFEINLPDGRRLCNGGRYDELTGLIGDKPIPAVGFAYNMENIVSDHNETNHKIVTLSAIDMENGVRWASRLRDFGIAVCLDFNGNSQTAFDITVDEMNRAHFHSKTYNIEDSEALATEINKHVR